MVYEQLIDGEGISVEKDMDAKWRPVRFKMACCDCGLVHHFVIINGRKCIGLAGKRDARATAARRREQIKKNKIRIKVLK